MNSNEAKELLKQINQVRYPHPKNKSFFQKPGKSQKKQTSKKDHTKSSVAQRPRKRKNESDRDFVFRINGYRCRYTNRVFPKSKLSLITLYPERTDLPKWKNMGCAWTQYALEKGSMNDDQFWEYLSQKKKDIRQEAYEYSYEIKQKVFERYQYKCIYCEYEYGFTPKDRQLTIDHKIPISKGGTNDFEKDFKNLACACREHNFEKGDSTAPEFFKVLEARKDEEISYFPVKKEPIHAK